MFELSSCKSQKSFFQEVCCNYSKPKKKKKFQVVSQKLFQVQKPEIFFRSNEYTYAMAMEKSTKKARGRKKSLVEYIYF